MEKSMLSRTERKEYIQMLWDFNQIDKKSILGMTGFIVEGVLMILFSIVIFTNHQFTIQSVTMKIAFLLTITIGLYFWLIWAKCSKDLRKMTTMLLNKYADIENFSIPQLSPFNAQYIPEVALLLLFQFIMTILLFIAP